MEPPAWHKWCSAVISWLAGREMVLPLCSASQMFLRASTATGWRVIAGVECIAATVFQLRSVAVWLLECLPPTYSYTLRHADVFS